MKNAIRSTLEREFKNLKFKKLFGKSYRQLLLSELIIALMNNDQKSVRQLANAINLSPTTIQKLRSGEQQDIKMSNFINIAHQCGYKMFLEKDDNLIQIQI